MIKAASLLFRRVLHAGVRSKPLSRGWRSWRETWAPKSRSWKSESAVWRCGSASSSSSPAARWAPRYSLSTLVPPSPLCAQTAVSSGRCAGDSSSALKVLKEEDGGLPVMFSDRGNGRENKGKLKCPKNKNWKYGEEKCFIMISIITLLFTAVR